MAFTWLMSHGLGGMGELALARNPQARPDGAHVSTKEMIAGAPRHSEAITTEVRPLLEADVQAFERWARSGRVRRGDFRDQIAMIWAMTQAHADHARQYSLRLDQLAWPN
jgi:TetR/AcrR family transcriptional regulator